jgi:hypothetical protein
MPEKSFISLTAADKGMRVSNAKGIIVLLRITVKIGEAFQIYAEV